MKRKKEVKMSRYYRYKNGAAVIVRPDLERGTTYYMRSGILENTARAALTYSQAQRLGQLVHIKGKRSGRYYVEEDWGLDAWTDDMFEVPNECTCSSLL